MKEQTILITVCRNGGMNQREIGELMGIDYSAVSVMRKRLSAVLKKNRNLSVRIERLKKRTESSHGGIGVRR